MNGLRDRNESVERLLERSLGAPAPADATPACLDAETMAAWVDGALTGAALEQAQAHVADCARCQALAATIVRTDAAGVRPHAAPARTPWWRLLWLAPLTAAAAAIVIYVSAPARTNIAGPASTSARVDVPGGASPSQEPAFAPGNGTLSRADNGLAGTAPVAPPAGRPESAPDAPSPPVGAPALAAPERRAQENADARTPAEELRKEAARNERETAATADTLSAQAAPASAAAPAAATPGPAAPTSAAAAPAATSAASAAVPAAPAPQARALAGGAFSAAGRVGPPLRFDVVSPDPMVRWRVAGAKVERSTDGGATWMAQVVGNPGDLAAGSSPLPLVCWLVGRQGVVLETVDGETWRQVRFPEITDLSAVQASSARDVTVTTAAGRMFHTSDAGVTWSR